MTKLDTQNQATETPAAVVGVELLKNGMATAVTVDPAGLSDDIRDKLVAFALNEKASNALAGAKKAEWDGETRTAKVQAMIDELIAGNWSVRATGGAGLSDEESEILKVAYTQARQTVASLCAKPDDGFPRAKDAFLDGSYTVTEGGHTTTGQAVFDKLVAHPAIIAQAKANVALKAKQASVAIEL